METYQPVNPNYMTLTVVNDTPATTGKDIIDNPFAAISLNVAGNYYLFSAKDTNGYAIPINLGQSVSWGTMGNINYYSSDLVNLLKQGGGSIYTEIINDTYNGLTNNANYPQQQYACLEGYVFKGGYDYAVHVNNQLSGKKDPNNKYQPSCTIITSEPIKYVNNGSIGDFTLNQGDKIITTADDLSQQHGIGNYEFFL